LRASHPNITAVVLRAGLPTGSKNWLTEASAAKPSNGSAPWRSSTITRARPNERRGQCTVQIAGTQLIREWQGISHCVTVRTDDFEYLGRPYKSLSSVAHEITGTKWNGWVFFGLKNHPGRS
jgi:hypothetical protein